MVGSTLTFDYFSPGFKRRFGAQLGAVVLSVVVFWAGIGFSWAMAAPATPDPAFGSGTADSGARPLETVLVPNGGPADASDIPSEMVSRFVSAYLAVVALIEAKEPSLQRAETDTESRQMQAELQREALGLITDHGLTLPAYWELLGLANSDPEFRERVLAQVEEASL